MALDDEKLDEPRIALITACGSPGGTGWWTARHLIADGFNIVVLASSDFEGAQACCVSVLEAVADDAPRGLRVVPLRLSGALKTEHAEVRDLIAAQC